MLKICLSKNVQKRKFHDLTHAWWVEVCKGYENKEFLKFLLSRLLKSLTEDDNYGNKPILTVDIQ